MMSNTIMDIEGEDSKPQQGEIQSQEYVVGFFAHYFFYQEGKKDMRHK